MLFRIRTGMSTTIEQVRSCLQLLFSGSQVDPQQRRQADRWLNDFQKTVEAWQVADALLQSQGTDAAAQAELFFGAQTIHAKIRYDFSELPEASVPSLRDSLMAHLQVRRPVGLSVRTQFLTSTPYRICHRDLKEVPQML